MSVTVMRTSGFSSRWFCTSSCVRDMSTSTVSWNAGTVHASVRRRAIVLRTFESGRDSTSPDGRAATGAAAAGASACTRSTSSATIRPSGPVPCSDESSMPRSRAMRRASGEALIRPFVDGVLLGAGCASAAAAAAARPSWRSGSRFGASAGFSADAGASSPALPMNAIVSPTGTSPSDTAILIRTPSASASTSCVTLSVSSSQSGSPFWTASPSRFSHLTIVPDSIPWPSRGSLTSVATLHRAENRLQDVVGVRGDELLHHRGERQRRELRPDPLDRRVEPVERLVLDDRRDLGADPHPHDRLVRDHAPVRLLHRLDQRLLVERQQRPRIDDL